MLDALERLRRQAVQDMVHAFDSLDAPTEVELRDAIHALRSADSELTEEGWYTPPPHGIIVAFGKSPNYSRIGQDSYRPQSAWPSSDIRLTDDSIVYLYQSRVHRPTCLITDVAFTLYRGSDALIHSHIANVYDVTMQICETVEVGMTLADVYRNAAELIDKSGMINTIVSVTDPAGVNIGHTIPWTDSSPTADERNIVEGGNAPDIANLINSKRVFVNASEDYVVRENCVFSIEPRLHAESLPTVSFHFLVGFEDGNKRIFSEFADKN